MSHETEAAVTEKPVRVGITADGNVSVRVDDTFQVVLPPNAAVVFGKAILAKALAANGETGSLVVNVIPTDDVLTTALADPEGQQLVQDILDRNKDRH